LDYLIGTGRLTGLQGDICTGPFVIVAVVGVSCQYWEVERVAETKKSNIARMKRRKEEAKHKPGMTGGEESDAGVYSHRDANDSHVCHSRMLEE
jgi:hypothetical protein